MLTRREEITRYLEAAEYPITAQDLCERLGLKKRSIIYEDIDHIARSVKHEGKEVIVRPASCGKCHFVFSKIHSAKAPTKCPKCKSEWILAPAFLIRKKK
ncbi:transcriptional regulator [Candidatus Thorarchaeota archaeon]|nr:MAG: transcriptional regulator [Candidatus Thorarchaeota archaeon]